MLVGSSQAKPCPSEKYPGEALHGVQGNRGRTVQTWAVANPTCALCDQRAETEDVPLTWVTSVENGRRLVYCDRCARENVRSIESKLDRSWW
ncbi:MAG: hypothetical protein QOH50_320 [Kribbellaceae bacterium]|jgi:hypothetical protein|nr:hypothetical protein [Kribbellaceae bacterium]